MNLGLTYIYLLTAVIFGTSSNIFAKNANGFSKIIPSILSVITIIICMYSLSQVMKNLSPGIAYGTFAGLCILATTLMSIIKYNHWPNLYSFIGLLFIVVGVILVSTFGKS